MIGFDSLMSGKWLFNHISLFKIVSKSDWEYLNFESISISSISRYKQKYFVENESKCKPKVENDY